VTPSPSSVRTQSVNRTASRACETQYWGEIASSSDSSSPETFDAIGIRGGESSIVSTTARKSSSIGSIEGEWNA
jgi:hypothetical protein